MPGFLRNLDYWFSAYMRTPVVRWIFYVLVATFLVGQVLLNWFAPLAGIYEAMVLQPADIIPGGQVWQLLTYGLVHGSFGHLLVNGLLVFFFGSIVEQSLGSARFAWLMVLSVLAGGIAHTLVYWGTGVGLLGFSGACFAILVGGLFFAPDAKVYLYFVIPMKLRTLVILALVLEGFWLISGGRGNVSHLGHLAGAGVGFAFILFPRAFSWLPGCGRSSHAGLPPLFRRRRIQVVKSERLSMGHPGRSDNADDRYDDPHWKLDQ